MKRRDVLGFSVALVVITIVWIIRTGYFSEFRFDDTFMTLRYARNFLDHGVLSFNVDDRVDGFTSPGWAFLLTAMLALGADGESGMLHASVVCGWLAVLAAIGLARRLGSSWGWAIAVAGVGPLSTTGFLVWSASGMETAFAALTACLALIGASRAHYERPRLSTWLIATALVVCATARPENAMLTALVLLHVGVQVTRDRLRSLGERSRALVPFVLAGAVLLVLFFWHWSYYGYPLPNTFYAKIGSGELAARGQRDLVAFLRDSYLWLAPLAALARVFGARSEKTRSHRVLARVPGLVCWRLFSVRARRRRPHGIPPLLSSTGARKLRNHCRDHQSIVRARNVIDRGCPNQDVLAQPDAGARSSDNHWVREQRRDRHCLRARPARDSK
jgi:hypothetical protein